MHRLQRNFMSLASSQFKSRAVSYVCFRGINPLLSNSINSERGIGKDSTLILTTNIFLRRQLCSANQESEKAGLSIKIKGMSYTVKHDTEKKCFYIALDGEVTPSDSGQALLEYDWDDPKTVEMFHTEVPPQFQGQGIAKHLAKAAFDYFSETGVMMRPTCTYLQKYLRENPMPVYLNYVTEEFKYLSQ